MRTSGREPIRPAFASLRSDEGAAASRRPDVKKAGLSGPTQPKCRQPYQPDPALLSLFYPQGRPEGVSFMSGDGCAACDYLGFKGRVGLYEYWELTPEIVLAISENILELRDHARRSGLMSLVTDGINKVEQGATTLEELRRVVPLEQIRAAVQFESEKD